MAAPASGSTTTTTTVAGQDEPAVPLLAPAPVRNALPRAIQLVLAIVWSGRSESSSAATTPASSTTTTVVGDLPGVQRFRLLLWMHFVFHPCMYIATAASLTYLILSDKSAGGRDLVSGAGGFFFVAIIILLPVYNAVLLAAVGHLGLFAPRTPVAAWEALYKGTYTEGMGLFLMLISLGVMPLVLVDQAWPLLFAWTCLLGLLIASVVAFWLCLLRTYGDGDSDSGGERRCNNGCGETTVVDSLAYLYCRLLYEYAVRLHPGAGADADAGMQQQQLDVDVAVV